MNYLPDRSSTVLFPLKNSFFYVREEDGKVYFSDGAELEQIRTGLFYEFDGDEGENIWMVRRQFKQEIELISESKILEELEQISQTLNGYEDTDIIPFVWITKLYDYESGQYLNTDILLDSSATLVGIWEIGGFTWLMVDKFFSTFIDPFELAALENALDEEEEGSIPPEDIIEIDRSEFENFHYFKLEEQGTSDDDWVAIGLKFSNYKGAVGGTSPIAYSDGIYFVDGFFSDLHQCEIIEIPAVIEWRCLAYHPTIPDFCLEGEFYEAEPAQYEYCENEVSDWKVEDRNLVLFTSFEGWFIKGLRELEASGDVYRINLLVNKRTKQVQSLVGYDGIPFSFAFYSEENDTTDEIEVIGI